MKAISPVIATVIIVAVAIAIAVAVAFWMTGITGTFTRYEKLEVTYAYAESISTPINGWKVTIKISNTGPSDATIDDVFINGKPLSAYAGSITSISYTDTTSGSYTPGQTIDIKLASGDSVIIYLYLSNSAFDSGQTVEIKIHTAAGNEYPKQVTLP